MSHEQIKAKLESVCKLKEQLIKWVEEEFAHGKENVDTKEMGEAVDILKDFAEMEKACWSAAYYEEIVKQMGEAEANSIMGYNMNRSMNTGRYTRGYSQAPMEMEMPYIMDYLYDPNSFRQSMRMGYQGGTSNDGRGNSTSGNSWGSGSSTSDSGSSGSGSSGYSPNLEEEAPGLYDSSYRQWKSARRHYTETGRQSDKEQMKTATSEHVASAIATMREMWESADPEQRKRMKSDLQKLVSDMG